MPITHSPFGVTSALAFNAAIRGNASEILSLRDDSSQTKGVDTLHSVEEAEETARILATELHTTLAITGPVDLVTERALRPELKPHVERDQISV